MAYNIRGLRNKKSNTDFISYVKKFDVFLLFETFVEREDIKHFDNLFEDHQKLWIPAIREARVGRASGGCLFGISLEGTVKNKIAFCKILNKELIKLKLGAEIVYIYPVYLNCNNWAVEFDDMCNFFSVNHSINMCLIGDFNSRVGCSQIISKNMSVLVRKLNH